MAPTNDTPPALDDAAWEASNHTDTPPTGAPVPWSLGGEPPEPQKVEPAKPLTEAQGKRLDNAGTHTGTDPLGRAIGPAEDHKTIKKVRDVDGKVVTPDAKTGLTPAQKKAREKAEADAAKAAEGKA